MIARIRSSLTGESKLAALTLRYAIPAIYGNRASSPRPVD